MEVIGLRNKTNEYIVIATETELNAINGVDDVVPISGRIRVGTKIEVSAAWKKLKTLLAKSAELSAVADGLRTRADELDAAAALTALEV